MILQLKKYSPDNGSTFDGKIPSSGAFSKDKDSELRIVYAPEINFKITKDAIQKTTSDQIEIPVEKIETTGRKKIDPYLKVRDVREKKSNWNISVKLKSDSNFFKTTGAEIILIPDKLNVLEKFTDTTLTTKIGLFYFHMNKKLSVTSEVSQLIKTAEKDSIPEVAWFKFLSTGAENKKTYLTIAKSKFSDWAQKNPNEKPAGEIIWTLAETPNV